MDSCVLSHNSAKPSTINGINRSYAVIYVFDSDKLIGLGRALCDGEYQAAISIYDVVLLPEYQVLGEKYGNIMRTMRYTSRDVLGIRRGALDISL